MAARWHRPRAWLGLPFLSDLLLEPDDNYFIYVSAVFVCAPSDICLASIPAKEVTLPVGCPLAAEMITPGATNRVRFPSVTCDVAHNSDCAPAAELLETNVTYLVNCQAGVVTDACLGKPLGFQPLADSAEDFVPRFSHRFITLQHSCALIATHNLGLTRCY
jgi:hypothetical protein